MNSSAKTRAVKIGRAEVGGGAPILVQSMTATHTQDIDATVRQVRALEKAGAGIVRIAVDSEKDAQALARVREKTSANLSVDLQENYRLAPQVAPWVDKIRYNPGHLYHLEKSKSIEAKVAFIVDAARKHSCAIRIGVNCGSVDPELARKYSQDNVQAMVESAVAHCEILDRLDYPQYVVSLKDSDPKKVIDANRRFAALRPDVPLHLGVTEAGLPPGGVIKTRKAFEPLLSEGIGDTIRVSLTVPNDDKAAEVVEGLRILDDVGKGRFTAADYGSSGLNIISCPSCSRVENEAFIELAQQVRELTQYAKDHDITIAVMGCRVNGPGETDDADLGLWCGPTSVNLKRKSEKVGSFGYREVLGRLRQELDLLIRKKKEAAARAP